MAQVYASANAIAAVVASDDPIFEATARRGLAIAQGLAAKHVKTGHYEHNLGVEKLRGQGQLRNRIDWLITADDEEAQLIEFGAIVHATGRVIQGQHIMARTIGLLVLDEFVQTLLDRANVAVPARKWSIASELAVKSIDQLPVITHDELSDGQTANGPGLWLVHLTLSVYQDGKTALNIVTRDLYDFVHGWESDESGRIDDVGWVQKVEDTSLFSTPGAVSMIGKTIRQANGLFDLTIHTP